MISIITPIRIQGQHDTNRPIVRLLKLLFLVVVFHLATTIAIAQEFTVDPGANFSWPPPVYVLRGEFTLRGTANLPNMANYFIEYRRLNDDTTPNEDEVWIPATLPQTSPVTDDALGVWDTTLVDDGPYEVRMTINVSSGNPVFVILSPLRVENTPPLFVIAPVPNSHARTNRDSATCPYAATDTHPLRSVSRVSNPSPMPMSAVATASVTR